MPKYKELFINVDLTPELTLEELLSSLTSIRANNQTMAQPKAN